MSVTVVAAVAQMASEALKQIPNFDERKQQEFEEATLLLNNGILNEDSDLILDSLEKITAMSISYKGIL